MKKIKLFVMTAVAVIMMSCGGAGVDTAKASEMFNKAMSGEITQADVPEIIEMAKTMINVMKDKLGADKMAEIEKMGLSAKEQALGENLETYQLMNQMITTADCCESKLDDKTQAAYAEYKQLRKDVLGY